MPTKKKPTAQTDSKSLAKSCDAVWKVVLKSKLPDEVKQNIKLVLDVAMYKNLMDETNSVK